MRVKEPFTMIKRTLPSGKKVWYYRYYDENGVRTPARSTGETTKALAYDKVMKMYKQGKLQTGRSDTPTFEQFASDFWKWEASPFLQDERKMGRSREKRTCDQNDKKVSTHFIPYLGNKRLDMILTKDIQDMMSQLKKKGLSNSTINIIINSILSPMFNEAKRLGYISHNPASDVMRYQDDSKEKGILAPEEVLRLFSIEWDSPIHKTANELAACTGMRIGEVQAIRGKHVKLDYIEVAENWKGAKYGSGATKTKTFKTLPLPPQLIDKLHALRYEDEEKFLFSDTGKKPFSAISIRNSLYKALEKIGIDENERRRRNITFHSWRHYLATRLAAMNVDKDKRMKMTGHASEQMIDHYTHMNAEQLKDVLVITGEIYTATNEPHKENRTEPAIEAGAVKVIRE